jgi:hypothetical protein
MDIVMSYTVTDGMTYANDVVLCFRDESLDIFWEKFCSALASHVQSKQSHSFVFRGQEIDIVAIVGYNEFEALKKDVTLIKCARPEDMGMRVTSLKEWFEQNLLGDCYE